MYRMILAVVFAAALFGPAQPSAAQAPGSPFTGDWSGELRRGEAVTPIRLHIDDRDAVTVDFPDLVYAWEPAEATAGAEGLVTRFPFGIGPVPLQRDGDRLTGGRGSLSMTLARTPPPPFTRTETPVAVPGTILTVETYSPMDLTGPTPVIVVAGGGAENAGRVGWGTRSWCDLFVRRGLVCLVYARRPNRGEDGSVSTLTQDADDLVAVIDTIRARADVDPARLGVFGRSRGAWIAAEATTRTSAIRFLMLSATAATTPSDQDMISLVARMTDQGRPAQQIADAIAYERLYFYAAHTGRDWPVMNAMARRAETEPWGEFVDQPLEPQGLEWWGANGSYDPRAAYRSLRMPVFATWGGQDLVTPPEIHLPLLRELMRDNPEARFQVFPGGDHRGEHPLGESLDGQWRWFGMAPGLLDAMDAWLVDEGLAERKAP